MSVEDKIEYVQALWDLIAANESQVPVPDWHREVLHVVAVLHQSRATVAWKRRVGSEGKR